MIQWPRLCLSLCLSSTLNTACCCASECSVCYESLVRLLSANLLTRYVPNSDFYYSAKYKYSAFISGRMRIQIGILNCHWLLDNWAFASLLFVKYFYTLCRFFILLYSYRIFLLFHAEHNLSQSHNENNKHGLTSRFRCCKYLRCAIAKYSLFNHLTHGWVQ